MGAGSLGVGVVMRLGAALVSLFVMSLRCAAHADDYQTLKDCVETANAPCLEAVGARLADTIPNPRDKSLMMARFGLIDWASGRKLEGGTRLLSAWAHLAEVPNDGCSERVDATFAFEHLAALFGNDIASRAVLRGLVKQAAGWPKDTSSKCSRPPGTQHWLAHVAARQSALGDADGLRATLDLAMAWATDPVMKDVDFATRPAEAAELLSSYGSASDAEVVCTANRTAILGALAPQATPADRSDAEWRALQCYREANLNGPAQQVYADFANAKLDEMGLAGAPKPGAASGDDPYAPALWDLVQKLSWNDAVLAKAADDAPEASARDCFLHPTADCLTAHVMTFVDSEERGAHRASAGAVPDFHAPGALDGFAHFLVGAGGDVEGDQARDWFIAQSQQAPLTNLRAVVGDAARAGDLVWARRMFYSWYTSGGESYFHHLTDPDSNDKKDVPPEEWPIHVAWSIALVINELDPAFEPEELASFAETAWDDGITQLPALRDIPVTELIDTDERSGEHLLDLCFRDAFSEWAAGLFTHAHLPDRAKKAGSMAPEAARDCAFAKRSVGPILRTADWYARQGDQAQTRSLLLEAADRLTRPHYHIYDDADPAVGGSALAAMALGMKRGLIVPPPYESVF